MNKAKIPVFAVAMPEYQVETEPDHTAIGKYVDDVIKEHFAGKTIVVRGLASSEHPGKTIDELIEIIMHNGTDRYDPSRKGDRYENIQGKHIDLFAFRRKVSGRLRLFKDISWGFYHGSIAVHGKPARIDILTIYDVSKLKSVLHQYEGRDDKKRDGFVFKDAAHKLEALLGIIRIN